MEGRPSEEGAEGEEEYVQVTFLTMPQGDPWTTLVPANENLHTIKAGVVESLGIAKGEEVALFYDGAELEDARSLAELGLEPHSESGSIPIEVAVLQEPEDKGQTADTHNRPAVEIVYGFDREAPRPFYGGFRDRRTGTEYSNAYTQTPAPEKTTVIVVKPKNHRETQTVSTKTRSTTTVREAGTQMAKVGVYIDERDDKVLVSREFFSSAQDRALKEAKAITIQRFARGMFARRKAVRIKTELAAKQAALEAAEAELVAKTEAQRAADIQRRLHPRSRSDFELLQSELEIWRFNESQAINTADMNEEARQAALAELLSNETKLLQTIDRLKVAASSENRDANVARKLELMAAPKKWAMSDGSVTQVHTPFTVRAQELKDLYAGLKMPLLTVDERLDVLFHVKWTVKEFDCNLTRDIAELIDREADLLHRGRSEKSLAGLRRRLANLFLQFVETPEFNPEAARWQKIPAELVSRPNTRPIPSRGSRPASQVRLSRAQ